MMRRAWPWVIRVSAFPRKEFTEIVRQPLLVLALVLGPFLILFLFGATLRDSPPVAGAIFVAPPDSPIREAIERFGEGRAVGARLVIEDVTGTEKFALDRLRSGDVDLVAVFPGSAAEAIRANERATITIYHNRLDPIETEAITVLTLRLVDEANQRVLAGLIGQVQDETAPVQERTATTVERLATLHETLERAQQRAIDPNLLSEPLQRLHDLEDNLSEINEALERFGELSPEVIVTPFAGATEQVTRANIRLADFYAPAAVALLLQHFVVTFVGLSIVREEQFGTTELFHVAPLSMMEALLGRYLAYLAIGGMIGGAVITLLVYALGVPMLGSWVLLAIVVAALLFTSIGVGFLIALVSKSDSQAVQYAMIVLLASIFFSGFLLTLDRFAPPLPIIARLLPVTYGVELLRDVMLRGHGVDQTRLQLLTGMGGALLVASFVLLQRRMRRA
ncbi:MAG: ABC transporter permease [Egibacteraceae bacterium]